MANTKLLCLTVLIGLAAAECDPWRDRNCNPPELTHLWEWRWFGALAWLRTFNMWDFFVYFPLAIAWTKLNRGTSYDNSDYRFLWLTYRWAGIAGWVTSALNIITGIALIAGHWDDDNWMGMEDMDQTQATTYGIAIIIDQIISQILYYFFRPGATIAAKQYVEYHGGQSVWERDTWKYTQFDADYKYLDDENVDGSGF